MKKILISLLPKIILFMFLIIIGCKQITENEEKLPPIKNTLSLEQIIYITKTINNPTLPDQDLKKYIEIWKKEEKLMYFVKEKIYLEKITRKKLIAILTKEKALQLQRLQKKYNLEGGLVILAPFFIYYEAVETYRYYKKNNLKLNFKPATK